MPWLGRAVGRRIAGTDDPTQPMSSLGIPNERQPLGEHTSKLVAAVLRGTAYEIGSTLFGRDRLGAGFDAADSVRWSHRRTSGARHDTDQPTSSRSTPTTTTTRR